MNIIGWALFHQYLENKTINANRLDLDGGPQEVQKQRRPICN